MNFTAVVLGASEKGDKGNFLVNFYASGGSAFVFQTLGLAE